MVMESLFKSSMGNAKLPVENSDEGNAKSASRTRWIGNGYGPESSNS